MDFKKLTNTRPKKDLGRQFVVSCVPGQLKLTPETADALKVGSGSYVGVVSDVESGTAFIFKGSDDGLGGKLAGSSTMSFSAAAAWQELNGDTEVNTYYDVAEEPVPAEDLEGSELEGKELFALTLDRTEQKTARKSSKSTDSDSAINADDSKQESDAETEENVNSFDDL